MQRDRPDESRLRRHEIHSARLRRLFATDIVNGGLPIHIGAALLGHPNLQTTQDYVAVFAEDIVQHYQQFLNHRRSQRPDGEILRCHTRGVGRVRRTFRQTQGRTRELRPPLRLTLPL
ncbi:tyrosine-type recombinase/integrase [Streptomyces sp. NPDC085665]|uniref:tyrosine-type recombinase/integrase n=1 Tax=Streptomyces sp. NPDC085665 TaxID=3365735 RepID=UPI0037D4F918